MMCISYMESLYTSKEHTKAHLAIEWRRLAGVYKIEIEEDPDLALQRTRARDAELKAMMGDFE